MKTRKSFLYIVLTIMLASILFWAGTVYAATGCFNDTNGHWAETAICWLKDSGVTAGTAPGIFSPEAYVTRAQMAVFMQKLANIPPSTGLITITEGFGNWVPFSSSDNLSWDYFSGRTWVSKATTGSNFVSLHPSIPTIFYGRNLQLVGVEFCYDASTTAQLSYLEINVPTNAAGTGTQNQKFSDATDRTDAACRYYVLSTPVTLTVDNGVNMFVGINWTSAGTTFELSRTTFVLQPTGTIATPPSFLPENTTILTETFGGSETDAPPSNGP